MTPTARRGQKELVICSPDAKAPFCISRDLLDLIRNSWRTHTHTASVSPADVRSDPIDSFAVDEVPKTLGIPVGAMYSPKAGKQTAIDKFCNLLERCRTAERNNQRTSP